MDSLLRRLSVNLERRGTEHSMPDARSGGANMPNVHSFNDFSMHVAQEVDEPSNIKKPAAEKPSPTEPRQMSRRSFQQKPSPFVVGSAPSGMAPIATKALSIPRTSVANILLRDSSFTPRSSLDTPTSASSQQTPRTSMSEEPSSPRSPTTPGGRRRREQKIHGLDYYEFCELVRAGSL